MSEQDADTTPRAPFDEAFDSMTVQAIGKLLAAFLLFGMLALLFVMIHAIQNGVIPL